MLTLTGEHNDNEITQTFTEFVSDTNGSYLSVIPKIYEAYKKTIEVSDNTWFHGAGGEGYESFDSPKELLNEEKWKAAKPTNPALYGYVPPKIVPKIVPELKTFYQTNTVYEYIWSKMLAYKIASRLVLSMGRCRKVVNDDSIEPT